MTNQTRAKGIVLSLVTLCLPTARLAGDEPKPAGQPPANLEPAEQLAIEERLRQLTTIFGRRAAMLNEESTTRRDLAPLEQALADKRSRLSSIETEIRRFETDKDDDRKGKGVANVFNAAGCGAKESEAAELRAEIRQLESRRGPLARKLSELTKEAGSLQKQWWTLTDPTIAGTRTEQEAAAAMLTECLASDPGNMPARVTRGFAYWRAGRSEQALADFNAAVSAPGPLATLPLVARGGLQCAMGKRKEGMDDFTRAAKLNKLDPLLPLFRGWGRVAAGEFQRASDDFRAALKLNPGNSVVYQSWALLDAACPETRFRNGKRAVDRATRACELTDWQQWQALAILAAAYAESGHFDQAAKQIARAAALTYGENREQCLLQLKQYENHKPLRLTGREFLGLGCAALPVQPPPANNQQVAGAQPRAARLAKRDPKELLRPTGDSRSWRIDLNEGALGTASSAGEVVIFEVLHATGTNWHLQAFQVDLDLKEGQEYTVRFLARATQNRTVTLTSGIDMPDWHVVGLDEQLSLTTDYQSFKFKFRATNVLAKRNRVGFALASEKGDVMVKEMSLVESE